MSETLALLEQSLFFALKVSLVLVLGAACAGIATSVVLTAFQIQDQALPFAVKLIVVCVGLAAAAQSIGYELLGIVDETFALVASSGASP
ncbi:type III secretion protein S [Trinickia symbiotica]|uniref:EscS/YscS/HrcS family type III secretion system export apparatus protein n=1 Tax=Trinickia symbiotica TaxID=863227 RepID=A0A2N7X7X4_9BURK|nr:flagellar biosynthetic protein FliQ [Trinickia symbiotica]PMS37863.1 hypothetical protein C0Z20_03295 [Trinickia symbiotica]PPK47518.1 type III secretion protein S [Trinickia symbiotica]